MIPFFEHFAAVSARAMARPWAFMLAALSIVVWAATGPIFGYSETWQLVINTGTTVITFLMAFIILNSSERESRAMQVKMDEMIRALAGARNDLIGIEAAASDAIEAEAERVRREAQ